MEFDFFYGSETEQFTFFRIPKTMMLDKRFFALSLSAKTLYSVLLDRMGLSMRNHWVDQENRVYIIYKIADLQKDLGLTKRKAMECLAELEQFGLLVKKKRGFGLPSLLYVKSVISKKHAGEEMTSDVETDITAEEEKGAESCDMSAFGVLEEEKAECRDDEICTSGSNDTCTSGGSDQSTSEVHNSAALFNKTELNDTKENNLKSNHIVSRNLENSDENRYDMSHTVQAYRQIIKNNIDFDALLITHALEKELIEGIYDLILETVLTKSETLLIAGSQYPTELVKSKFLKLTYTHIEYVIDCFTKNTTKVRNVKKYLLAALFNAPSTIDGYYRAEVNHDMYGGV